jgi:hypothetical protein
MSNYKKLNTYNISSINPTIGWVANVGDKTATIVSAGNHQQLETCNSFGKDGKYPMQYAKSNKINGKLHCEDKQFGPAHYGELSCFSDDNVEQISCCTGENAILGLYDVKSHPQCLNIAPPTKKWKIEESSTTNNTFNCVPASDGPFPDYFTCLYNNKKGINYYAANNINPVNNEQLCKPGYTPKFDDKNTLLCLKTPPKSAWSASCVTGWEGSDQCDQWPNIPCNGTGGNTANSGYIDTNCADKNWLVNRASLNTDAKQLRDMNGGYEFNTHTNKYEHHSACSTYTNEKDCASKKNEPDYCSWSENKCVYEADSWSYPYDGDGSDCSGSNYCTVGTATITSYNGYDSMPMEQNISSLAVEMANEFSKYKSELTQPK